MKQLRPIRLMSNITEFDVAMNRWKLEKNKECLNNELNHMYTQVKFQFEDPYVSRVRHNSAVREINTYYNYFKKMIKRDRLAKNILKHE